MEYARMLNIPYREVLRKNTYVVSTFIQPTVQLRQLRVSKKFGPLFENFAGKRIVLTDDSIVRGNMMGSIVKRFGAKEVQIVCTTCQSRACCWQCRKEWTKATYMGSACLNGQYPVAPKW